MVQRVSQETVAGAVFVGVRNWFECTHGPEKTERLFNSLDPKDKQLALSRALVNTSRVPAHIWCELGAQAIAEFGTNGDAGYHAAASAVAMDALNGYMKVLMKLGTPSFVLSRFPRVWRHYFSGGELTVEKRTSNSGTLLISDAEEFGEAAMEGAVAWMRGALSYSGGKEVNVLRTRLTPSDSRYQLRWK